jgi:hypothetical protein
MSRPHDSLSSASGQNATQFYIEPLPAYEACNPAPYRRV